MRFKGVSIVIRKQEREQAMAYEDPNAPRHPAYDYATPTISTNDESINFLGGQHHPWRRFFSRLVEINTSGVLTFTLLMLLLSQTIPKNAIIEMAIQNLIINNFVLHFIWVPVEAFFLSRFGTTPAKWLFGIRIENTTGSLLSFPDALKRAFLIFIQGVGFGIPFATLIPQSFAYYRLIKTNTTLWDAPAKSVVRHKKWGIIRAISCTAIVLLIMIANSVLIAALYQ